MADVNGFIVPTSPVYSGDARLDIGADADVGSLGSVATVSIPMLPIMPSDSKAQFASVENLELRLHPFNTNTGSFLTGGVDVVTITLKAPDGTVSSPVAAYDADAEIWVASVLTSLFQEGEWLVYAISEVAGDATGIFPQFLSLWWGDYVDDILEARQAAMGRWKIEGTTLRLYEEDGVSVFKEFSLKDASGQPSNTAIFDKDPI